MRSIDVLRALSTRCHRVRRLVLGMATLAWVSTSAAAASGSVPTPPDSSTRSGSSQAAGARLAPVNFERRIHDALNRLRVQRGLEPLDPDLVLSGIARRHSERMAHAGRLSHTGFGQRFREAGGLLCVENVAKGGLDLPERLIVAWLQSGAHARNLVEPRVRLAGVARAGAYTTWMACDSVGPASSIR